jgi:hypothetical protein
MKDTIICVLINILTDHEPLELLKKCIDLREERKECCVFAGICTEGEDEAVDGENRADASTCRKMFSRMGLISVAVVHIIRFVSLAPLAS